MKEKRAEKIARRIRGFIIRSIKKSGGIDYKKLKEEIIKILEDENRKN